MHFFYFSLLQEAEARRAADDAELERRDDNVANLKLIVQRLTSNNNDMLAILASKASVDDVVKKLEADNLKLTISLEAGRQKNLALEKRLRQNEAEAERLQHIIR